MHTKIRMGLCACIGSSRSAYTPELFTSSTHSPVESLLEEMYSGLLLALFLRAGIVALIGCDACLLKEMRTALVPPSSFQIHFMAQMSTQTIYLQESVNVNNV